MGGVESPPGQARRGDNYRGAVAVASVRVWMFSSRTEAMSM